MQPTRHWRSHVAASVIAVAAIVTPDAGAASAEPDRGHGRKERSFAHVATFDVRRNGNQVSEIVDTSKDGKTLIYTDSATGSVGFVDITDPSNPLPAGRLDLGGSPTSVGIGREYALVAVDTSAGDFDRPSGQLIVIEVATRAIVKTFPLGGQPDAVAISPDGRFATVVLENQRDESENGGLIPQLPAGQLVVIETSGSPNWWPLRYVDFTGLAMFASTDPEPEFADINGDNLAVVTFQENNHLAVVDLDNGNIVSDFSAGSVTLDKVDATEEKLGPQRKGIISLTDTITRRREPDSVGWIDGDSFAIANEGDYEDANGVIGGGRGFTVFRTDGTIEFESGPSFEYESVRAGHYNEGRSANKGGEAEALEVAKFGDRSLLFVGAERANVVGVYDVTEEGSPRFLQVLPTGIGPEGLKAIPKRNLLVAASEKSVVDDIPSMITIYEQREQSPAYPQLASGDDANGLPIPWVAMSGLAGSPTAAGTMYGVNDSFLAQAGIYTIDVSQQPAVVTDRVNVTGTDGMIRNDLDLEGIAVAPEGGFWLASEGRTQVGSSRPNAILRVDANGVVQAEIGLPAELLAAGLTSSGLEGVAVTGDGTTEYVYTVVQREWPSDAPGFVKIGRYEVANARWTFVSYGLDAVESPLGGWVGLSEITLAHDGTFLVVERDNRLGSAARIKRVYGVDLARAPFAPFVAGTALPTVAKTLVVDVLDILAENSIWTPDKLEGLGLNANGELYLVTDNDGLDDALGQTVFMNLGLVAAGG